MKKTGRKVKRIRFKRVFLAFLILFLIIYVICKLVELPIRNIIVKGNSYLKDQQIIDIAGISNYPSILRSSHEIEKKLKKDKFIKDAKVKKTWYFEVRIKVEENLPIFYDATNSKTVLKDGTKIKEEYDVPILVNYIPDTIYKEFVNKMGEMDYSILKKISEIKYEPNTVDEERFVFYMSDKNKAYVTLNKIKKINNYNDIMKKVLLKYDTKKGTLYLDEGEYFVVNG